MSHEEKNKVVVTAPLNFEAAAMVEVANSLGLPPEEDRQPDLQYLTAIFVSSGMNKNGAIFMGSELVKARKTIVSKAVDIEHDEQTVIGHITNSAFVERDGTLFDAEKAFSSFTVEELDERDMDIAIAAVVHKTRFPYIASDILDGEWMVSMEAFFRDYDIKVGDMIIPRDQAEAAGYDKLVGSVVQLKDGDSELGFHLVGRILRDIVFAGVGIVKNPANPRSVIMEAAAVREYVDSSKEEAAVLDVALLSTPTVTAVEGTVGADAHEQLIGAVKAAVAEEVSKLRKGVVGVVPPTETKDSAPTEDASAGPGICVNFKRYVAAIPGPEDDTLPEPVNDITQYPLETQPGTDAFPPGTVIEKENYCTLFELECSSRPGDATHPECWRNVFARTVREEVFSYEEVLLSRRVKEGLESLQEALDKARS